MTIQRRTPTVERRPAASSVTARRRRLQRHVGSEPLPLTALADIRLSAEAGSHTTLSLTDRLRDKTALVFSVLFLYYSLLQSPSLILHNSGDDWIREIVFRGNRVCVILKVILLKQKVNKNIMMLYIITVVILLFFCPSVFNSLKPCKH